MSKFATEGVTKFVEIEGKPFPLKAPSLGVEGEYQKFLESRAIASIRRNRAAWGDEYPEIVRATQGDVAAGKYEWFSPVFWESLKSAACVAELCYLCVAQSNPMIPRSSFAASWEAAIYTVGVGENSVKMNRIWDDLQELMFPPNSHPQPEAEAPADQAQTTM